MYNILFSLPVHERLEVVYEQIVNINTLNPNCAIVVHISPIFNKSNSLIDIKDFTSLLGDNVYINPKRLPTRAYDIIQAHISNFEYASSVCDFEYYAMIASNEMFIRNGLYDYIKGSNAGLDRFVVKKGTNRSTSNSALEDSDLHNILEDIGGNTIYTSQIEGSYYRKNIFEQIITVINKRFDYRTIVSLYAREEIYFPTVFWNLFESDTNVKWMFTFVPWDRPYTANVRLREIKKLQKADNCFCVKRVPRKLDDCVRIFLRQDCGYFNEIHNLFGVKKHSQCYIYANELKKEMFSYIGLFKKAIKKIKH